LIKTTLVFAILLCSVVLSAQNKSTLEAQRKKLLDEISFTQKSLEKTRATRQATLNDLAAVEQQINLRQSLIKNTSTEVRQHESQIRERQQEINRLEEMLQAQRKAYAESIYKTYRHQRFTNQLLFIASSSSFAESLRRINYLRKYAISKRQHFVEIMSNQSRIQKHIDEIEAKRIEKQKALDEQLAQRGKLDKDRKTKDKMVKSLRVQEDKLNKTLADKKVQADKLNKQIEDIIRKEIAAAQKKAEEEAKKKAAEEARKDQQPVASATKTETKVAEKTPVAPVIPPNAVFSSLRGKLPWPVDKGFISRGFGQYNHPELPNVKFDNNGIDIRTDAGSNVRAIFDGKVVGIINNPTYKNAVIVSHGEYFTVYSKLTSVNVTANQSISARDKIGTAFTDTDQNVTEVHLEIWRGAQKLNPAEWLAPR
jgi:murein hydrolase activator